MVLFFCATLLLSILGLASLLYIKRWELRTGRMLLSGVRPALGGLSHKSLHWVERGLPVLATTYARRGVRAAHAALHRGAAWGLLLAERGLEYILEALRGVTEHPPKSNKEASVFLREVAEHKRQLLYSKEPEKSQE
jgi:hypothetical protein